jgi:hypothetical protein
MSLRFYSLLFFIGLLQIGHAQTSQNRVIRVPLKHFIFYVGTDGQIQTVTTGNGRNLDGLTGSTSHGGLQKTNHRKGTHAYVGYWPGGWGSIEGRICQIGDIEVMYYGSGWGPMEGKVKSIGNIPVEYYGEGWGYKAGKIKSIGKINLDYPVVGS